MSLYTSNGTEKSDDDRIRRNDPRIKASSVSEVECDGTNCPAPGLPQDHPFCEKTVRWYWQMAHSPQSKLFADTDWLALEEACILHDRIWNPATPVSHTALVNLMSELRRRVAVWGYNHYDRIQLKLTIETPQTREAQETEVEEYAAEGINYLEQLTRKIAEQEQNH